MDLYIGSTLYCSTRFSGSGRSKYVDLCYPMNSHAVGFALGVLYLWFPTIPLALFDFEINLYLPKLFWCMCKD
ncbi:hypothetical protein T08_14184 [Trichinella sp. T8]|nr:hypothetical protein T08_14184 [Trichinella sp. T8]